MVPTPNKSTPTETSSSIKRRDYLKLASASASFAMGGIGGSTLSSSTVRASNSNDDFVIDDFEDNDLSEYSVDRGSNYNIVTSPTYEGHYGLELADEAAIELISTSGLGAYPQAGDTFSVRFRTNGTGGGEKANFTYGVQSHTDRYYVVLNPGAQEIRLFKYKDDSSIVLSDAVTASFSADTWHVLEVDWETDGTHTATLYDEEADTQLAQVTGTDSEWTSGGIGFDAYLSTGEAVYFDDVTFGAAGFLERDGYALIDDFEDGNLSEYSFDRGASGASVVTSPAYHGSQALAISGTDTELISTEDLSHYPSIGTSFSCWVRATGGAEKLNLTYGVQDHDNRYYANLNFNKNRFSLYRWDNSSTVTLDFNDSGFTVSEDAWYKIKVHWDRDGTHTATLYDASGHRLVQAQATDTTWESGGVGYDAYLASSGGTVYFDFVTLDLERVSEINVVDNFEDGNLDEYEFDRGQSGASVVSNPVYRGSNALEINGTNTEMISMSGLQNYPAAGDVFSYRVRATGGANKTNFTYGVQNHLNRYYVHLKFADDSLVLLRYEDGSSYVLDKQSSGFTLSEDEWYEVTIDWQEDGTHTVSLYDSAGGLVAQVSATDSTWPAGGVGYDAYLSSSGGTVYYDQVMLDSGKEVLESNRVVDDFEDGNFAEYEFDSGTSTGVSIENTPTRSGANVLKISGVNREMISTSGLETYPSSGDVFSCWVQGTNGLDDVNFTYGVQNYDNRYYVNLDFASDLFGVFKYENGSTTTLATDDSLTLTEDRWYNIEVDWRQVGTHTVTLYDSTGARVAQVTTSDTTWLDGGIGFDAYLGSSGGSVYFDYVAIHSSVLDDFEDGDITEYNGDTGSFTVQNSTVLEGNQTLKGSSAGTAIAHTDVETPRGYEYTASVKAPSGSGAKPALMACIQDPLNPLSDCYYVQADTANDKIAVYKNKSGNSELLGQSNVTLDEDKEYRLRIELKANSVIGAVLDANGTSLKATGGHDKTLPTGRLGLYLDGGSPGYFDYLTKRRRAGIILDDFEDGEINEYAGDTAYYSIQTSTTLQGNRTLKSTNQYRGIANTAVKTPRKNEYRCFVMAESGSNARPGLLTCVQDPDAPIDNCYWVQASSDNNNLNLFRRDGGSTTVLDQINVTIDEGAVYRLAITLSENEVKASIATEHGVQLAETKMVSDTTYAAGNLGFYSGAGEPAYYDYVVKSPTGTRRAVEVSATSKTVNEALNSTMAQEVLSELNNPSTNTADATRQNYYGDGQLDFVSIDVPIEYGKLQVGYNGRSLGGVIATLDRSMMPDSLIADISGDFGWPSSTDGTLLNTNSLGEPKFTRTATSSERNEVTTLVSDYDIRDDAPGPVIARNNDGGVYRLLHYDKIYHVDSARTKVTSEEKIIGSPSQCAVGISQCMATGTISIGVCGVGAAGCLGGLSTPVPGDEAIICGIAVGGCVGSVNSYYNHCDRAADTCEDP